MYCITYSFFRLKEIRTSCASFSRKCRTQLKNTKVSRLSWMKISTLVPAFFVMRGSLAQPTSALEAKRPPLYDTQSSIINFPFKHKNYYFFPLKEFCEKLNLKPGEKVLDVGCGIGGSAFHMARKYGVEVRGVDLSTNMITIALENQAKQEDEVKTMVAIPYISFEYSYFKLNI